MSKILNCLVDFIIFYEVKMFLKLQNMYNQWRQNIPRKMYKKQLTASKVNDVRLLSSVHTKTIFNVRASTINFKMKYVRVVLCTCVQTVHKFCSAASVNYFLKFLSHKRGLISSNYSLFLFGVFV